MRRNEGNRLKSNVVIQTLLCALAGGSPALAQSKPPTQPPSSQPATPELAPLDEKPLPSGASSWESLSNPEWDPEWEDEWAARGAVSPDLPPDADDGLADASTGPIIGESAIALLGATVSAAGGFGLAYVTNKGCINESPTNPLAAPFGCGLESAGADLLIWVPGGVFMTPALVDAVGAGAGSYGWGALGALVGGAGGTAIGVGLMKGINPESKAAGAAYFVIPIILLNAAGAVVGYELGVGENTKLVHTPASEPGATLTVVPWVSGEIQGVGAVGLF
jgi:hypothetical protein